MRFTHTYSVVQGRPTAPFSERVKDYHSNLTDGVYTMHIDAAKDAKTLAQLAYIHVLIWAFAYVSKVSDASAKLACKEIVGFYDTTPNPIRGAVSVCYKSLGNASKDELANMIRVFFDYLTIEMLLPLPTSEEWGGKNSEQRKEWKGWFKKEYE